MTEREARIIVVTALRWARAREQRDAAGRLLRRRERELAKACAQIEQPPTWRRVLDRVLGGGKS